MNSRTTTVATAAAAGPGSSVSRLSAVQQRLLGSKIKFNVPFCAGEVHKSQLLICMDCGERPHPPPNTR